MFVRKFQVALRWTPLLALAALLISAAPAQALWSAPHALSKFAHTTNISHDGTPGLVANARGAAAVGMHSDLAKDHQQVQVRTRAAGTSHWSDIQVLDDVVSTDITLGFPSVVVTKTGTVVAVWFEGDWLNQTGCTVKTASKLPGGAWSTPTVLYDKCSLSEMVTADGPSGAVATWTDGDTNQTWTATMNPSGAWSASTSFPYPTQGAFVMGSNSSGLAVLVLRGASDQVGGHTLLVSQHSSGRNWTKPVAISGSSYAERVALAVSGSGDISVLWDSTKSHLMATTKPAGGRWSSPTAISVGRYEGHNPTAVYQGRTLYSAWENVGGLSNFAMKRPGHAWTKAVTLSKQGNPAMYDSVAVDSHGVITVAWSQFYGGRVKATTKAPGHPWTAPKSLTFRGYATWLTITASDAGIDLAWDDTLGLGQVGWARDR